MIGQQTLPHHISGLFSAKLNLEVPSFETDLLATGILDSLTLVELLVQLEQEYGTVISVEDLEIKNFSSIAKIAEFVANHNGVENPSS